jgi:hypothetical protein
MVQELDIEVVEVCEWEVPLVVGTVLCCSISGSWDSNTGLNFDVRVLSTKFLFFLSYCLSSSSRVVDYSDCCNITVPVVGLLQSMYIRVIRHMSLV